MKFISEADMVKEKGAIMNEKNSNRQVILQARPKGMPDISNFSIKEAHLPKPQEGEVLVRSLYFSVDPYMRGRMNDGASYIAPFEIGQPLTGGVVGRVEESCFPELKEGDIVQGMLELSDFSLAKGAALQKLNPDLAPISTALGVLGMPGMTAYFGLLDIGKPVEGETVVVSGAAGAVGMLVGQIAKIKGCHVVGIAGSDEKVKYLVEELKFDAAINYKNSDYAEALKNACPRGVDIYFDNVGGDITDQVLKQINSHARIVICGQISMYNLDKPDVGPRNWFRLLTKSALAKGFIIFEYHSRFSEGIEEMANWLKSGKLKYHETVVEGLENTPKAFLGLFTGENIGKQIVKV